MTTVFDKKSANRVSLGEVNIGKGQLGILSEYSGSTTTLTLTPDYYDKYYIPTFSGTTSTVVLPIIGDAATNVRIGWRTTFIITPLMLGTFGSPFSILFNNNANNVTFYTFYGLPLAFITPAGSIVPTSITITAVSAPATWDFTPQTAISAVSTIVSGISSSYFNGSAIPRSWGLPGRLYFGFNTATNINVLIATPAQLTLVAPNTNVNDTRFLTNSTGGNSFTTLIAGTFQIESQFVLAAAGGGSTINVVMIVRKNGINAPAAMSVSSPRYTFRMFVSCAIGDVLTLFAGKSVVSLGTTTFSTSDLFSIKYLG
jgi:hypothetical protein